MVCIFAGFVVFGDDYGDANRTSGLPGQEGALGGISEKGVGLGYLCTKGHGSSPGPGGGSYAHMYGELPGVCRAGGGASGAGGPASAPVDAPWPPVLIRSEPLLIPKLQSRFADFPWTRSPLTRGCPPWRPAAVLGTVVVSPAVLGSDPW